MSNDTQTKRYEVKVVMEYWVHDIEANSKDEAKEMAYMQYQDWEHTATLYDYEAFELSEDLDDEEPTE